MNGLNWPRSDQQVVGSAIRGPTCNGAAMCETPWRDVKGIAAHLGYSVKRIHAMTGPHVTDGMPYHRVTPAGGKRFHVAEVDTWLLERC